MKKEINILFIGVICSEKFISKFILNNTGHPNLAAQKYHRLLLEGISRDKNYNSLQVISLPEYNNRNKLYLHGFQEETNNVKYEYLSYLRNKTLKYIVNFIEMFIVVFKWKIKNKKSRNYIMFDVLTLYSSISSIIFSKIFHINSITTITDLPEYMYVLKEEITIMDRFTYIVKNLIIRCSDVNVTVTQAIVDYINNKKKHIVIEGLVDNDNRFVFDNNFLKEKKLVIHYSGGLYEKFGVKALIEAFMQLKNENISLHLFGNGDLLNYIKKCSDLDNRIIYFGYLDNHIVVSDQFNSFVLVNPRFSHEEYTKYSFPSKTIEYMASGIPLLTNKLPGIPDEYLSHVFTFDEESVEGYRITLERLLDLNKSVMIEFGKNAQSFVYKNKNNKLQAYRLFEVLSN